MKEYILTKEEKDISEKNLLITHDRCEHDRESSYDQMTTLIMSMLLRQQLHISQHLQKRIFIGPQQEKIKILNAALFPKLQL